MPTQSTPTLRRFLRRRDVEVACGFGKSTLWKLVGEGRFPKPTRIGDGVYVWPEDEVAAWQARQLAEAREATHG
jgi:prophage regulatory protein